MAPLVCINIVLANHMSYSLWPGAVTPADDMNRLSRSTEIACGLN
ncbi:hypothetical protein [Candidatus Poriferisocius sp.]